MAYKQIIWTIKELVEVLRARQLNEFDVNIGISGRRGNGKSTLAFKIFNSFKKQGFKQDKHQVYSRDDVVKLLSRQTFSYCWDDEAINSGYKRDFQNKGQQELIKIITNFRDNYNIYASALPFFYSLDKDLRELIFLHIHIIERGVAVLFMPSTTNIHSQDPWDTKRNIKVEEQENKRVSRNPNLRFRYNRFSTFAGYLYFTDMTAKQKERYKGIKRDKRNKAFDIEVKPEELLFIDKVYNALIDKKLSKDVLLQMCIIEGKKYSGVISSLNKKLTDNGIKETAKYFLLQQHKEIHNSYKGDINNLVPSL